VELSFSLGRGSTGFFEVTHPIHGKDSIDILSGQVGAGQALAVTEGAVCQLSFKDKDKKLPLHFFYYYIYSTLILDLKSM
jgi:hypothetical protein